MCQGRRRRPLPIGLKDNDEQQMLVDPRRNSIQAPPNGNQIGGSHPIYFPFLNLRNDGEVLGGGFDFSMRKAELRVTTLD